MFKEGRMNFKAADDKLVFYYYLKIEINCITFNQKFTCPDVSELQS